ncbi:MAG: amidohydrolase family protein, partial [Verrucomicrobiales bacterium]
MRLCPTILIGCLISISSIWANDILPAASVGEPVLLYEGTLHPISGPPISKGKLLMRAGLIVALGGESDTLEGEEGANRISCEGQHVYPGLISANGTLGLVEISAVRATRDLSEPGPINPSVRAETAVNPDSELLPVARANGILTTLSVPQGGIISGRSALLQLDGWTWEDMVLKAPVGMHLYWPRMRTNSNASEDSIKSQRKNWEERLLKLETFFSEARAYQKSKLAQTIAFRSDVRFESMLPVIEGRLPLYVHALGVVEIQKALQFIAEQELKAVLVSGQDVWRVTSLLKARGIPVILDTVQGLPLRRWEPYDSAMRVPAKLLEAGIPFCIANGSG